MKRAAKAAPARRAGYPKLRAAWRLLVGAPLLLAPALGLADASVPKPKQPVKPAPQPPPRVRPHLGGDDPAPEPPRPPDAKEHPPVPGGLARPRLPQPGEPAVLWLHPHGPEEPCIHFERTDRRRA